MLTTCLWNGLTLSLLLNDDPSPLASVLTPGDIAAAHDDTIPDPAAKPRRFQGLHNTGWLWNVGDHTTGEKEEWRGTRRG